MHCIILCCQQYNNCLRIAVMMRDTRTKCIVLIHPQTSFLCVSICVYLICVRNALCRKIFRLGASFKRSLKKVIEMRETFDSLKCIMKYVIFQTSNCENSLSSRWHCCKCAFALHIWYFPYKITVFNAVFIQITILELM